MSVLKVLAGQRGRIPRKLYWLSIGVHVVMQLWFFGFSHTPEFGAAGPTVIWGVGAVALAYLWLLAAAARSRDAGKSGAMALLILIPVVGFWAVVWLGCEPSIAPDPEEVAERARLRAQSERARLEAQTAANTPADAPVPAVGTDSGGNWAAVIVPLVMLAPGIILVRVFPDLVPFLPRWAEYFLLPFASLLVGSLAYAGIKALADRSDGMQG